MAVRLTKRAVDTATTDGTPSFLWDTDEKGFGLRVAATGARSYVYQYRMGGRESPARRHTIGKHGSPWTPETARKEARRLALLVSAGVDPVEADKERRRIAIDLSFEAYVNLFNERYLLPKWKQAPAARASLIRHAVPAFGRIPISEIKRSDISSLFDGLASIPGSAKLLHSILRKMFRWAVQRGDLDRSPMEGGITVPAVKSRDRVLGDDELRAVWISAQTLTPKIVAFFQLLILTGARRGEVAGLDWAELSRPDRMWALPPERSKNGSAHLVPLSTQSMATLDRIAGGTEWPKNGLALSADGVTPISGFGQFKARLDRHIEEMHNADGHGQRSFDHWRVHDLRRTLATGLQRLGVRFEVTEAVLNHLSGARSGVAGVYQRHHWKPEKEEALQAWGDHVEALVTPGHKWR